MEKREVGQFAGLDFQERDRIIPVMCWLRRVAAAFFLARADRIGSFSSPPHLSEEGWGCGGVGVNQFRREEAVASYRRKGYHFA